MTRYSLFAVALFFPISAGAFELKDGDRVVLIGSTLIEREQRYGYWEAALTARNPDKNITFRNLGWSGDTVWGEARAEFGTAADGYKHLIDHVRAEKPTVIVVGYGTNESYAGADGLPKFKEQLKKLLDDLSTTKPQFVLLSPMKMLKLPPPMPDPTKANENIALYAKAIDEEAKRRGALFISLLTPRFIGASSADEVTENGLHLTEMGYVLTEDDFVSPLSKDLDSECKIDARARKCEFQGVTFTAVGDGLRFKVKPRMLSSWVFIAVGLPEGNYKLIIDGDTKMTASAKDWGSRRYGMPGGLEQYSKLRRAIVAKNELYFHRWRPQNTTYLFGFRKHEQGNNAREIPQFDPLVEAKEKEISELKKPREHIYELVPAREKKQ
jgi:lysophospholipase L1-like esterase